ncbi:hypothetical protein LTR47_007026 [Exophiala xenobiotica]|nr:hypothetical protein LTR41_001971 [Exophiala xenobiotica]KAK5222206.1 hypothetical protein LTR72_006463 [Exophiala xenobiotica]KAK5231893.1 hypothetical protein LTR47_007026 [Exophiala xenobiotica]KAK5246247.1 hypothetical protein LTS06_008404 [Exophiala xenobiotica]KAK5295241.1 hypothetical protein LTR14_004411 [Exophiala xenobiotica]
MVIYYVYHSDPHHNYLKEVEDWGFLKSAHSGPPGHNAIRINMRERGVSGELACAHDLPMWVHLEYSVCGLGFSRMKAR